MKVNTLIGRGFFVLIFSLVILSFSQKPELDSRIVGRWKHLFDYDESGNLLKNEFSGKNYITTYSKDGRVLLDPNYFRDDMKRHGGKEPLDYAAIPSFNWKTKNNEILELITPNGNLESFYRISSDTLILISKNGGLTYQLRVK
jgi:hypothetical protein